MDSMVKPSSSAEHQRGGVVVKGKQIRIFGGGTVIDRHPVEALVIELDQDDASTVGPQLRAFGRRGLVADLNDMVLQHGAIETHFDRQRAALLRGERVCTWDQFEAVTDDPVKAAAGGPDVKQRLAELEVMRRVDRIGEPFLRRGNGPVFSVMNVKAIVVAG